MKKITQLVGIILFISAFNTAQASTYNDLKGSYTLVASSDNSKTCPKGYWIGDAKCDDGLWVQERKTHFTTVICNINGGLQNKSSGGHPHSPIPNPENTSTKNIFDSSKKSLSSKTTSISLLSGLQRFYSIYTILESGNLKLTKKFSDGPIIKCEYSKDASSEYMKSIE